MKCHSKRFSSRGAACIDGSGWLESSLASLRMRLIVGDFVLNVDAVISAGEIVCR